MPMVSATDIPLTPYPTGRTSPQAPSDYQQIQTSPAMFGSIQGEALQRAGQEGEKLATEIAKLGAYQQHFLDITEQDKMSSQLDDVAHKRKYGDPTAGLDANGQPLEPGFKNRYGSDAIDYIKSGAPSKDFNDDVARIAATASNDRVRAMFLHQSRARRASFDNSLDEHWTSQLAVHAKDVQKATIGGINRDLASGYNNDLEVNNNINRLTKAYIGQEKDPKIQQELFNQGVTDGAEQPADAALAAGDPQRANEIYQAYKGYMSGSDQLRIERKIKHQLDLKIGDDAYRRARGGAGVSITAAEHYSTAISLGASPNEAALLTSAATVESNFNPAAIHDAEILAKRGLPPGYGLYGHNAERLAAMQKEFGPQPTAAQQIQFALKELRSRPEGARVNAAKTPEELTDLQLEFENPGPAGVRRAERLAATRQYLTNPPKAPAAAPPAGAAAPAATAPGATAVPAVPATPRLVFYGDSIAHGTREAMRAPGNTKEGRVPSEVLGNIGGDKLQGETAVISSGITNSRDNWRADLPLVPQQIAAARKAGAGQVVLFGVGEGVGDNRVVNAELQKIARENNAVFVPLIGTGAYSDKGGVAHNPSWHPRDYAAQGKYTVGQVGGLPLRSVVPPAGRPRGMVEPPT